MQSLKMLYKIGKGPSSSHTMGPQYAAEYINENYPDASFIKVILYGSLAKTGKGHGTDRAIKETLKNIKTEITIIIMFFLSILINHPFKIFSIFIALHINYIIFLGQIP